LGWVRQAEDVLWLAFCNCICWLALSISRGGLFSDGQWLSHVSISLYPFVVVDFSRTLSACYTSDEHDVCFGFELLQYICDGA